MKFDVTTLYKIPWDVFWIGMTGLAAGVLSFYFNKPAEGKIKKMDVFVIISSGVVGSVYLGNGLIEYMMWVGDFAQMMRFIIGLTAIQIIRGIIRLSQIFANNPLQLVAIVSSYLFNRDITTYIQEKPKDDADVKEDKKNESNEK